MRGWVGLGGEGGLTLHGVGLAEDDEHGGLHPDLLPQRPKAPAVARARMCVSGKERRAARAGEWVCVFLPGGGDAGEKVLEVVGGGWVGR